jgi:hypothetical protein
MVVVFPAVGATGCGRVKTWLPGGLRPATTTAAKRRMKIISVGEMSVEERRRCRLLTKPQCIIALAGGSETASRWAVGRASSAADSDRVALFTGLLHRSVVIKKNTDLPHSFSEMKIRFSHTPVQPTILTTESCY